MTAHLTLACRPSPDEIIEARRDWFDAHADYAMTGQPRYRDERDSYEDDDPTGAMAAVVYLLGGIAIVGGTLLAIPMYCLLLVWTGGAL